MFVNNSQQNGTIAAATEDPQIHAEKENCPEYTETNSQENDAEGAGNSCSVEECDCTLGLGAVGSGGGGGGGGVSIFEWVAYDPLGHCMHIIIMHVCIQKLFITASTVWGVRS